MLSVHFATKGCGIQVCINPPMHMPDAAKTTVARLYWRRPRQETAMKGARNRVLRSDFTVTSK
jgi:hypothetical protein